MGGNIEGARTRKYQIKTYQFKGFRIAAGMVPVRYIEDVPKQDKMVHLIVESKYANCLHNSDFKKRFIDEAKFGKFKTFVSEGIKSYRGFISGENHAEKLLKLSCTGKEWQEVYKVRDEQVEQMKKKHENVVEVITDMSDLWDKFEDLIRELEDLEKLEGRLLAKPNFVVNALPILGSKDPIKEIIGCYGKNPVVSILSVHNTEGHVMASFEANTLIIDYVFNKIGHSLILETGQKRLGFVYNKTLFQSLGLVSFIKSVYPNIDLLLIGEPSDKTENEAANLAQKEAERNAVRELLKLGVGAGDVVTTNGDSKNVDCAIGTKVARFLGSGHGEE